jgi:hypothetical protein
MACGEHDAVRLSNCQPVLLLAAALPSAVRREGRSGGAFLPEQSENVYENKQSRS